MTFGTSNLLLFFLVEGYMIIKSVLGSIGPGLHNVLDTRTAGSISNSRRLRVD
jgi:hypothetical protein